MCAAKLASLSHGPAPSTKGSDATCFIAFFLASSRSSIQPQSEESHGLDSRTRHRLVMFASSQVSPLLHASRTSHLYSGSSELSPASGVLAKLDGVSVAVTAWTRFIMALATGGSG